jgi:hypothetical protein
LKIVTIFKTKLQELFAKTNGQYVISTNLDEQYLNRICLKPLGYGQPTALSEALREGWRRGGVSENRVKIAKSL